MNKWPKLPQRRTWGLEAGGVGHGWSYPRLQEPTLSTGYVGDSSSSIKLLAIIIYQLLFFQSPEHYLYNYNHPFRRTRKSPSAFYSIDWSLSETLHLNIIHYDTISALITVTMNAFRCLRPAAVKAVPFRASTLPRAGRSYSSKTYEYIQVSQPKPGVGQGLCRIIQLTS